MKRLDDTARRSAVVLTLLMVLVFLLAAWAVHGDGALGVDRGAKALIRDGRAVALETPMWLVGLLGTGYVLLPVTLVCSAVLWRRGHRLVAVWLPAVGVSAALAIAVVKWLIDKPRPTLRGYGFPSGHVFGVTVFVVLALYLFWSFEASPRWQRAARAAAVAFVAVVGYSRIHVNAHWLSDVVGGLLAGMAFALAIVLAMDARLR